MTAIALSDSLRERRSPSVTVDLPPRVATLAARLAQVLEEGPIFLEGPYGSGKTKAVEELSEHLGQPLHRANLDDLASAYVGMSGSLCRQFFNNAGGLAAIEEADSSSGDVADREMLSVILSEVDCPRSRGLVLTGCDRSRLDPSLLRRLTVVTMDELEGT